MTDKNDGQAEVVKANELTAIVVTNTDFFPDFKGKRIDRAVKIMDGKNKLTFGLPVPTTEEESAELYNLSLADLIEMGVSRRGTDADNSLHNMIKTDREAGVNFDEIENVAKYGKEFQDSLKYAPREKKAGAVKVAKKKAGTLDAIGASLGLSEDEMANMGAAELVALIKKSKNKK